MKRLSLTIASCLFLILPIIAKVVRNYESASDNVLTFKVDSIDYRNDLTRVYGKLIGRPHTSNRIDGVNMAGNNYSVDANDIDGVDFRRYFQWEDDGTIPIELDFPSVKVSNGIQIVFSTAHGQSTTTVKKISDRHK